MTGNKSPTPEPRTTDLRLAFAVVLLVLCGAAHAGDYPCPIDEIEYTNVVFKEGQPQILFGFVNGNSDGRYITILLVAQKISSQNGTWVSPDHGKTWFRPSGCWQGKAK